jgi:hypothetical protein
MSNNILDLLKIFVPSEKFLKENSVYIALLLYFFQFILKIILPKSKFKTIIRNLLGRIINWGMIIMVITRWNYLPYDQGAASYGKGDYKWYDIVLSYYFKIFKWILIIMGVITILVIYFTSKKLKNVSSKISELSAKTLSNGGVVDPSDIVPKGES